MVACGFFFGVPSRLCTDLEFMGTRPRRIKRETPYYSVCTMTIHGIRLYVYVYS